MSRNAYVIWAAALLGFFLGAVTGLRMLPAGAQTCQFATWVGTDGADSKTDNEGLRDTWYFRGGQDYGRSQACDDPAIYGEGGGDDIGGGSGNDFLLGGDQADDVYGGQGDDGLSGDAGSDRLYDREGPATGAPYDVDVGEGKGGNDTIDLRDGDDYDLAKGGAGTDTCQVDRASERDGTCEY
jgi:hypothetical protein